MRRIAWGLGTALTLASAHVHAESSVKAPAGGGQAALEVVHGSGTVLARLCRGACRPGVAEVTLTLPPELSAKDATVQLESVAVGSGRHVVHVRGEHAQTSGAQSTWEAVVHAPLGGPKPVVAFSGWTGLVQGQPGDKSGPVIVVAPGPKGTRRVILGQRYESVDLCGRDALLSPRLFSPKDMRFRAAKLQRLSRSERAEAPVLNAKRVEGEAKLEGPRLLRAVGASSAVGDPGALTDGKLETSWAENKGGAGRGEFVMMHAPPELPLEGFELVVRPTGSEPERAVAPKSLWLATTQHLFRVNMSEDGWAEAGARYRVSLPKPVQSDCVALVVESAWKEDPKARVTVTELSAVTSFDAGDTRALIGALAGGSERSEAAGAILRQLGDDALKQLAERFYELDEGGRRIALDVLDHAGCDISVGSYVEALLGPYRGQRIHGLDRLRRCGAVGARAIEAELKTQKGVELARLASVLAEVAPKRAIGALDARLSEKSAKTRRVLRVALARAARSPRARAAVEARLDAVGKDLRRDLEVLRALGPQLGGYGSRATAAFDSVARSARGFRERYLLLEPAAHLASSHRPARTRLAKAMRSDESHHIRAHAAALARVQPKTFQKELLAALNDDQVRVREAAAESVAGRDGQFAQGALLRRLTKDRWPLVRAAAAKAFIQQRPSPKIDLALAEAIADSSHLVRSAAVTSLGERAALAQAEPVRERLQDRQERLEVRAAAAHALGAMCDRDAVGELTSYARRLAQPHATGDDRTLGSAALAALGRLGPEDLKSRLSPFFQKGVPPMARSAAEAALRTPPAARCR